MKYTHDALVEIRHTSGRDVVEVVPGVLADDILSDLCEDLQTENLELHPLTADGETWLDENTTNFEVWTVEEQEADIRGWEAVERTERAEVECPRGWNKAETSI
jgi:hypothetical protein